ncbi:MAG: diguanylate cyclase [Methylacidiphilales bacterium]|nr:diguanylate cyclase [Candidatus Methylacidiphilales bacterium]
MYLFRIIDTSDCNLEISDRVRLRRLFYLFKGQGNALVFQGLLSSVFLFGLIIKDLFLFGILWVASISVVSFYMYRLTRAFFSRFGRTAIYEIEQRFLFLLVSISFLWGMSFLWFITISPSSSVTFIFIQLFVVSMNLGFYLYSFRSFIISSTLVIAPSIIYLYMNHHLFNNLEFILVIYLVSFFLYSRFIISNVNLGVRLQTLNENLNRQLLVANKQLIEESSTDYLTGIANRRTLENHLEREYSRALRQGYSIAVMIIDVDWFKKYNDFYGHLNGDDALRSIAYAFTQVLCRPGDLVARFGGEEFATVLSSTNQETALLLANRLKQAITDLNIPHAQSEFGTLSISVGVYAKIPEKNENPHQYLSLADIALYKAKSSGRNIAVSYDVRMGQQKSPS